MSEPVRIEKLLSQQGIMSRREAKSCLEHGWILVNNQPATPGQSVLPNVDTIEVLPAARNFFTQKETVLVYKPRGVLSSKDEGVGKNIFDTFPALRHLNCVGRLDKESEGLILLSNDGQITKALTGKPHTIEKEYEVSVRENVLPFMIQKLTTGIRLRDGWAQAVRAERIDKHTLRITLIDGRKHQIRRMANALKLTVTSLKRIRIGHLFVNDLRPGQMRKLRTADINRLKSNISPK